MKKKIYNQLSSVWLLAIAMYLFPSLISAQAGFRVNGSCADIGNNCFNLTCPACTSATSGSFWYGQKADLNQDFDMSANLNFGSNDAAGSDGITFTFQNLCTSIGGSQPGLGIGGVSPSLIVEFDTWSNPSPYNDPSYDHVALFKNGVLYHGSSSQLVAATQIENGQNNVEDGLDHLVRVLWTHADSTLKVYVSGNLRLTYTGNIVNSIFSGNQYVYWGFTGATGSSTPERVCITSMPASSSTVHLDPVSICPGGSVQVSLPGATTYAWSPNTNISSTSVSNPTLSPLVSTTYYVTMTDPGCNNTRTDSVRVTINPLPNTQLTLPFNQKCIGAAATALTGGSPSGGTYSGAGVAAGQFTASTAGQGPHYIYYTATNNFNCSATDSDIVLVNPLPNVTLGNFNAVCVNGSTVTLSGGSPSGGVYSGTGVSAGSFNPSTAGTGTKTITYSYTDGNTGCQGTATNTILVNTLPAAVISTPSGTVLCSGNGISLTTPSVSGVSYQWSLGGNTVSTLATTNTSYSATSAGSYTLLASSTTGCSATSSATTVTSGTTPTATISSSATSFCPGSSVTINSSLQNGETIQWFMNNNLIGGASGASYTATAAGNYKATITSSTNCSTTSSVITLTQLADPNAGASSSLPAFCPSTSSITLTATSTSGATLQWLNSGAIVSGETNPTYAVSAAGTYSVVATLNGCTDTSSAITLSNSTNPTADLTTSDSSFCPGTGAVTVTTTSGAIYAWFKDGNATAGSSPSLTVALSGAYYAVVTNSSQCSATSNTIGMTLQTAPTASITTTNTNICSGNAVTLTADVVSGVTYEWKRNGTSLGAPSSTNTYSATQAGSYTCEVSNGCASTSNAIVIGVSSAPAAPTILLLGGNNPCVGGYDEYKVSPVSGATSYTWTIVPANAAFVQQGQGTDDVFVTFLNQNCSIEVTANNSCGSSNPTSLAVTMNTNALCNGTEVAFGASPSNTCIGSTVTYYNYSDQNAVGGLLPVWDFGAGANPATSTSSGPVTVTYSSAGFKDVRLTYNDGFGNYVTSYGVNNYVNVNGAIATSAIAGNTTLATCSGNVESYSVTNTAGSSYAWTVTGGSIVSGQGTNAVSVNFPNSGGTVSVVETNAAGCTGSAQTVTAILPTVSTSSINGNTQLANCNGNTETYSVANTTGSTYAWTVTGGTIVSGQGTNAVSVNFPTNGGTVSVIETTSGGCVGSAQNVTATCPTGFETISSAISVLSIYPNPTNGSVTISGHVVGDNSNNGKEYQLQLTNIEGRTILSQNGNATAGEFKQDLQLSIFPKGIYFIRIKMEGEVVSRKVVLQ